MSCIFCEIVAGRIPALAVWEDRNHLLVLDIRPVAPGHLLLLPKKHSEDLFLLPKREYNRLLETARTLAPVLRPGELNPTLAKPTTESRLRAMQRKLAPRFRRTA